jgi:eukaryotic-like serine/threonine-protein kinase
VSGLPEFGGGYEALELLSRGNDFDVYDAWSEPRGCRVVIKTVRRELLGNAAKLALLLHEGRLLRRLEHPHIVRCYETVANAPRPFIVLETLGGQTLGHMIGAEGLLSDEEAAHVGLQLGAAVRYMHRNRLLHLDLKPSNAIAESGRARLIDLGLAAAPGPVEAGRGTWCYLAPEQARGEPVAAATDVWGLGATLYEAVSGWPPFDDPEREVDGVADEDIEFPQLERPARPLAEVCGAGAPLAALVMSCLQPDAAQRPPLEGLLAELEAIAGLPPAERRFSALRSATAPPDRPDSAPAVTER